MTDQNDNIHGPHRHFITTVFWCSLLYKCDIFLIIRERGSIELESFRNDLILERDNKVSEINENWYLEVSELFVSKHKQSLELMSEKVLLRFHKAVDTLMSNQVFVFVIINY